MSQATLAWAAFKNMMRQAARDPFWALVQIIVSPINGGIYLLNREQENFDSFPKKFSMEKDFFEQEVAAGSLGGFVSDSYFIDIGIPEDYYRAQTELKAEE